MITFRSEFLWREGMSQAVTLIRLWLENIADCREKVSRADYCIDVNLNIPELRKDQLVSYARNRRDHILKELQEDGFYLGKNRTGYSVGLGGALGFRLYDKIKEINTKSKKYWVLDIYRENGRDETIGVSRFEFQMRRDFLKDWNINGYDELEYCLPDLMRYAIGSKDDNIPGWLTIRNNESIRLKERESLRFLAELQKVDYGELVGITRLKTVKPKMEILEKQVKGCIISQLAILKANGYIEEQSIAFIKQWLRKEIQKDKVQNEVNKRMVKYAMIN